MLTLLERDGLLDVLDEARAGTATRGAVVLVAGEAGIGKTVLVRAFAERAAAAGARVAWSRCDDLAVPRALGAVHDLALHGASALREALRSGRRAESLDAVREELAREAPTVWIVEDVHWADGATLDVISYLGRRIEDLPALVVLTFRDDELRGGPPPAAGARAGCRRPRCAACTCRPLSRDAVAPWPERGADDLYAVTGGNAFFVTEALASGSDEPPPSVRDAVLARAGRLAPAARSALDLVAVVPGGAELWLVREAAGATSPRRWASARSAGCSTSTARGALPPRARAARHRGRAAGRPPRGAARAGPGGARALEHRSRPARAPRRRGGRTARAPSTSACGRRGRRPSPARTPRPPPTCRPRSRTASSSTRRSAQRRSRRWPRASYHAGRVEGALEACGAAVGLRREAGDALRLGDDLRLLARLHWWGTADSGESQRALQEAIAVLEPLGATPSSPWPTPGAHSS